LVHIPLHPPPSPPSPYTTLFRSCRPTAHLPALPRQSTQLDPAAGRTHALQPGSADRDVRTQGFRAVGDLGYQPLRPVGRGDGQEASSGYAGMDTGAGRGEWGGFVDGGAVGADFEVNGDKPHPKPNIKTRIFYVCYHLLQGV